jgi:hypothetical protein
MMVTGDSSEVAGEAAVAPVAQTEIKLKRSSLNNYHYHFALHLTFWIKLVYHNRKMKKYYLYVPTLTNFVFPEQYQGSYY